jgi:enoyl-CoA hydratase/carnithine racemase
MSDGAGIVGVGWRDHVAVLRWSDGENRFNRASVDALNAALDEVEATAGDGPLAVVLTGAGKFWSNGLDLDWMSTAGPEAGRVVDDVHALFGRLLLFPAITVAALNGHAFAGGAMLAAAHDFAVMREDRGYWCVPEADLGLPFTPAMNAVLRTKLPRRASHEAMLTGRRYPAAEALAAGIVHRTAPEAEVLDSAVALGAELATKGRQVIASYKQMNHGDAAAICGAALPA